MRKSQLLRDNRNLTYANEQLSAALGREESKSAKLDALEAKLAERDREKFWILSVGKLWLEYKTEDEAEDAAGVVREAWRHAVKYEAPIFEVPHDSNLYVVKVEDVESILVEFDKQLPPLTPHQQSVAAYLQLNWPDQYLHGHK